MDIVLGVSLTPKTVRMVLVEGEKGDGEIVDHDTFDVSSSDGSATTSAADQVVAAVVGTQESAAEGGHELTSIGVTWSDRAEAAELRDALAARGIRDVILVSELHAAGALAQAAGKAVGYDSTALMFIDRDSATLSVVRSDDGSIVKVVSRNLHSTDAMAVLADMVSAIEGQDSPPQGMFVVGSGVEIASVKEHLEGLVKLPVRAPEESALALARGAALAAANAPAFDATTAGLAYSLDPDGATSGNEYVGLAGAVTMMRPVDADAPPVVDDHGFADSDDLPADEDRKPFLLVGSALTSIFVIGVVALVISLAVSIRPTVDSRPDPGRGAIIPEAAAPVAPPVPEAQFPAPAPAPAPPPPAETIKPPVPVVQEQPQAPPRTVYVEAAPPQAPAAPPPAAPPPPPPAAPPPAPPAYVPPVYVPPVFQPPVLYPPVWQPPVWRPPVYAPPVYKPPPPWRPPWNQWPPQGPPRGDDDDWPQYPQPPQAPQYPQYQQQPQYPQQPWPQQGSNGSDGSQSGRGGHGGSGDGSGGQGGQGGRGGQGGSGGQGGNCFLIFCG